MNFEAQMMEEDPLVYIPTNLRVITKMEQLVPLNLWPAQEFYLANRTHRDVCLKNRQTGFSTGVMAGYAHRLFSRPYQRITLITHDQETSEFLFQTVQRFYHNLPWNVGKNLKQMVPRTDWKSGSRMRFPGTDSYIYIDSAKSDSLGIGHTLNFAHLSEMAKYPMSKAAQLIADITETVPEHGWITMESTPKGRAGEFFRYYDAAKRGDINYRAFFFPWWWDPTCIRKVTETLEYTKEEKDLINYAKKTDDIELTPQRIAFRREKMAERGDLFYQEYPEDDINCWLSSEVNVFDGMAIRRYLMQIDEGRQEGNLTIWKDAIGGERYVMGVDVAAGKEKGDWSVASIIRVKTMEYVARYRAKEPPDFFAQNVLRLAHRFNGGEGCEVAVERTGHGNMVLKILLENNYANLYYHQDYNEVLKQNMSEPGWNTTRKSKPLMVDSMAAALRSGDLISWSENLMSEASSYIYDGENPTRSIGKHDDELDAVMIALYVRDNTPIISGGQQRQTRSYATI